MVDFELLRRFCTFLFMSVLGFSCSTNYGKKKHSAIRHLFHYGQVAELAAKCTYTVEIGFKAQDLHKFIRYFWWAYIPLGVKNV